MSELSLGEALALELATASRAARVALAAACASRVLPLYENYWVGDYYAEVSEAVEAAWRYAESPTIDRERERHLKAVLADVIAYYSEEGIDVTRTAVSAAMRALECTAEDDAVSLQAAGRTLVMARDAAQRAEAMANVQSRSATPTRVAQDEECAWQTRALRIAVSWQGAAHRSMFVDCGAAIPEWLEDWLRRSRR